MTIKKRPFKEAREFVHKLKLKNSLEWKEYVKSGEKPDDIPADPRSYKTEWNGMGDWLGNGNIHPKYWYSEDHYMPFKEARELVIKKKIKSNKEYREWVKSGKAPKGLPPNPDHEKQWKDDWTNWINFLGKEFASYEDVKKYVHTLNLKKKDDWHEFTKNNELSSLNGKKIPRQPSITFKKIGTWKNWQDFLGYEESAKSTPKEVSFEECQKHALDNGIDTLQEWNKHYESGKLPKKFPKALDQYFRKTNQWKDTNHFFQLETHPVYPYDQALPIAQEFCRKNRITTKDMWVQFVQQNSIPKGLPKAPFSKYSKNVTFRWHIWCGIQKNDPLMRNIKRERDFKSYTEHQKFAEKNNITTGGQWRRFVKYNAEKISPDISLAPDSYFGRLGMWPKNGWYDFLKQEKNPWCTYEDAKKYLKPFNLVSKRDYKKFQQKNKIPKINGKLLPNAPESVYEKQGVWIDWFDFLGREDLRMTLENTKKLVKALIDSKIIHQANPEDQVVFAKLLMINEIYGRNNTKSSKFLKQLQSASLSPSGLKKIIRYAESDSLELPDITKDVTIDPEQLSEEKKIINKNEIVSEKDDGLLTDYSPQPTKDILKFTDIEKSLLISIDDESMKFFVTFLVHKLWNRAFLKEEETVSDVKQEGNTGNDFHDKVITTFLEEYKGTTELKIPKGYAFPHEPYLMQRYVAYKATSVKSRYFANTSEPGSGKTLSAILASRVMNAKTTLVLCPKNVIVQWGDKIKQIFPDSEVIIRNKVFSISKSVKNSRYLILNYDIFNQETSGKKIAIFKKIKIDFVIMDEIQFAKAMLKKNVDEKSSRSRRLHLEKSLQYIKENNPKSRRLGLSATPIINTLKEGRSLLELLAGHDYSHVKTDDRFFFNGVGMYEQLTNISIRQRNGQNFKIEKHPPVIVDAPISSSFSELEQNPLLIELELTDARISEIIKKIEGQTIIYTEYVGKGKIDSNIVKKLTTALDDKKITWGLYTGTRKYELEDFSPKNKFQVLICSSPISVGIDGLQLSCNRIIFNSLPWTHAQYEQIIGRIARKGQTKPIDVFHINARIPVTKKGRTQYIEYDQSKLTLIKRKQTLSDCAVDGVLPQDNKIITKTRAMREAVRWYKRLENEDYSFVFVEELDVPEIVEREQTVRKLGRLEEMHKQVFHVNSKKVHQMLKEDPQWIIEYHNEYRKSRQTWDVIPYEYYIKKLNEMSPRLKIGDFGCGEAKIRESLGDNRVKSIDHVAIEYQDIAKTKNIISCDMVDVSDYINDEALDVAVFSLSMWGDNWKSYFKEANRCLAKNGYLFVCETTAKMNSWLKGLDNTLKKEGFDVLKKEEIEQFTFIEARKI